MIIEGDELGAGFAGKANLQEITGAEILDRDNLADEFAISGDRVEADEIGVVYFVVFGLGQIFARDVKFRAAQRFGCIAVGYTLQAGDDTLLCNADDRQLIALQASFIGQRAIGGNVSRVVGIRLYNDLAADALGGRDMAEKDEVFGIAWHWTERRAWMGSRSG